MQASRKGDDNARTVRLFRNGRSQAVRIPKEMEFEGEEVTIRRLGDNSLVVSAKMTKPSLREVLDNLAKLPPVSIEEFPDITDDDLLPLDDVKL